MELPRIEKRIGNDPRLAVQFLEEVKMEIDVLQLAALLEETYKKVNIMDLEKNYDKQTDRIADFEKLIESRQKTEEQIDNMDPKPGNNHEIVKKLKRIEKAIEDTEWQGNQREEALEETRKKKWEAAQDNHEKKMAAVSKIEKYIMGKVEESIYLQIKKKIQDLKEPSERLKKMVETTKTLMIGDQKRERELMMRRLEDMQPALDNAELKKKINDMRIIILKFTNSAKAEGIATTDIDNDKLILKLGEISMGNGVEFAAKSDFREMHKQPNATFEKVAEAIEKSLDKAINKNRQTGDGDRERGMNISSNTATQTQVFANAATTAHREGKQECFNWKNTGACWYGDSCRFEHASSKRGSTTDDGYYRRGGERERSPYNGNRQDTHTSKPGRSRSRERDRRAGTRDRSRSREEKGRDNSSRGWGRDNSNGTNKRDDRRSRSPPDDRHRGRHTNKDMSDRDDSSGNSTPRGKGGTPKKARSNTRY